MGLVFDVMSSGIKVSVIIPSYNVRPYIRECLDSVVAQTLKDIEVIIVDAFSTDGTREIIRDYTASDSRIVMLDDTKGSTGYSNNMAIKEARGEYVAIVESDDYIHPDMLNRLYKLASQYDLDYVKGSYKAYWTQDDGSRVFRTKKPFEDNEKYNKVLNPKTVPLIATGDWYQWTGIYNRKFLIENNIEYAETKGAAFQDIGFLHLTSTRASRVMYVQEPYYNYCVDREGSSSNSGKRLRNAYFEFKRLFEIEDSQNSDDLTRKMLYARMAKSFMSCHIGIGDIDASDNAELDVYEKWFKSKLNEAIDDGLLDESILPEGIWDKLIRILRYSGDYSQWMMDKRTALREFLEDSDNSQVVIFGCGSYGNIVYRWLSSNGYNVAGFMDNDESIIGGAIDSKMIMSPNMATKLPGNTLFVTANEVWYREMRKQLVAEGIADRRIYDFE